MKREQRIKLLKKKMKRLLDQDDKLTHKIWTIEDELTKIRDAYDKLEQRLLGEEMR